jgi:RimJ/RimL family protein N-acetyltransferase
VSTEVFRTARLRIHELGEHDLEGLAELHAQPEVLRALHMVASGGVEDERTRLARAHARYAPNDPGDPSSPRRGFWGISDDSGVLAGMLILQTLAPNAAHDGYEIGWRLHPRAWGKGYATEAARGGLDLAFEGSTVDAIYAVILPENDRSRAVAERLGMSRAGELDYAGLRHDLFAMSREEWARLRST